MWRASEIDNAEPREIEFWKIGTERSMLAGKKERRKNTLRISIHKSLSRFLAVWVRVSIFKSAININRAVNLGHHTFFFFPKLLRRIISSLQVSHAVTQNQKEGWSEVRRSLYLFATNHVHSVYLILPLANEGTVWGWVGLFHLSIRTERFECALLPSSLTTPGPPGKNLSSNNR